MNKEQFDALAMAAASTYFNLLNQDQKQALLANPSQFTREYINIYDMALSEIEKVQIEKQRQEAFESSSIAAAFK